MKSDLMKLAVCGLSPPSWVWSRANIRGESRCLKTKKVNESLNILVIASLGNTSHGTCKMLTSRSSYLRVNLRASGLRPSIAWDESRASELKIN